MDLSSASPKNDFADMKVGSAIGTFGLIFAGALSSCNFYHEKHPEADFNFSQSDLNYATVRAQILSPSCTACHNGASAKAGVVLDSYPAMKANLAGVERAALVDQIMPPSHPLSLGNQNFLRAWINAGAPEGGGGAIPPPVTDPTYTSIRKNVFEAKCISCHASGEEAEKVPLDDYATLLNSPRELVLPGNAEESGLTLAIVRTDDNQMPPMKSGEAHLSEAEIFAIKTWIQNGAQDN